MYPEYMRASIKKVEATRQSRLGKTFPAMTAEQREEVLSKFHPDYKPDAFREVRVGPNKGEKMVQEVVDILEAYPRIFPDKVGAFEPDYETDVLVIGGGGAACEAALLAMMNGARVILATKLRIGDANTMMAQGGIQAAVNPNDSPAIHYLDVMGGGHFDNIPKLVRALVIDAPEVIAWLEELGVMFDKDEMGRMVTRHGGGTSRKRMHSARDYSGAAIMRVLRDEVRNHPDKIEIIEFSPAVELLTDEEGKVGGALLFNLETEEYVVVKAKSVVIATGGFGRLHVRGFPTTNHYGATADGLVLAYRVGAKLIYMDSVQYHPTGAAFPEQILGFLITEKVRGLGAQPVNCDGEMFVFPLEPRDVEAASFIRECIERGKGITTPTGRVGVWLDSPLIELIHGKGTIQKALPAMYRQFRRFNIDITKEPMLVYPTLHYQNGGVLIDEWGCTGIPNLFAAGEVTGGVHGRNRLMGNSLLDVNVFGRRAGKKAAENAKTATVGKLTLNHLNKYVEELRSLGIPEDKVSPILLPDYTPPHIKKKQWTTVYQGNLR